MAIEQQEINFDRIAKAIRYIIDHTKDRPSLDEIAAHVHLSPFHFQRIFTEWAGTSPKKFLQYLQVSHAKSLLTDQRKTLFDTHLELGISSTSRLHDLFVELEGMTPAEYKNKGQDLVIAYNYYPTPFGECLVASTQKGVCHMAFIKNSEHELLLLKKQFPNALFKQQPTSFHQDALKIFSQDNDVKTIKLHLKGTPFQLKVWQALLKIPNGKLKSYGQLAQAIDQPTASRAVGTAIGSNPVAYLIPCHRVIQASGSLGGYMWEPFRKAAIIAWEQARLNTHEHETI